MKNNKVFINGTIIGFLLFVLTIGITSTGSIVVYHLVTDHTNSRMLIGLAVMGAIILGAIICSIIDIYRRKNLVQKPVRMILDATKKIASGDFSVKLIPINEYAKYTEYDLIFENINIMTKELAKNEMINNDFISNVSHEIKTPLSVIQNYATVLKDDKLDKEKRQQYLNNLIIQTKKLSNLISNILKLNKLENQRIVPEIEEFDLAELLRVIILNYESLFENKQIELKCDISDIKIESSASLLEIVLNNLISNAIKFTDVGGTISVNLKQEFPYVVIEVEDSGCGISKEVGEHLFDKFYQGDTSHSSEGNGLGLALVKRVIDLIGGEISVKSKLGKGSTFIVKLKK